MLRSIFQFNRLTAISISLVSLLGSGFISDINAGQDQGFQRVSVYGMQCLLKREKDYVEIKLEARTEGWLSIGFNKSPAVAGTDLKIFAIRKGKLLSQDKYIKSAGIHPRKQRLDAPENIQVLGSAQQDGKTYVHFRIPTRAASSYHFDHRLQNSFTLSLAWSSHSDFDYVSQVREYVKFKYN